MSAVVTIAPGQRKRVSVINVPSQPELPRRNFNQTEKTNRPSATSAKRSVNGSLNLSLRVEKMIDFIFFARLREAEKKRLTGRRDKNRDRSKNQDLTVSF